MTNSEKTPRRKPPRKNASSPKPDACGLSRDPSSVLDSLMEERTAAQADRAENQAKILSGELILKTAVTSAIGNCYSTWRVQILEMDLSLGDVICAVFGVPETEWHKVRGALKREAYGLTSEIKERLEAFITGGAESEKLPRTRKGKTARKK